LLIGAGHLEEYTRYWIIRL